MQQNIELKDPQPIIAGPAPSHAVEPPDWWKIKLDAANIRSGIGLQQYLAEKAHQLT